MSKRSRARRLALQGLCCLDVQGEAGRELVDGFIGDSREPHETIAAARDLLAGAWAHRAACDELLARHAHHWELPRLALVDRNILRLALFELRSERAPHKVAISEALALAKEFSSADSPRFINGVLDAVARELARAAEKPAREEGEAGAEQPS